MPCTASPPAAGSWASVGEHAGVGVKGEEGMSKAQIWALLIILSTAIIGSLWAAFGFYKLSERRAWLACIKDVDQLSAQNLVCRSQYPEPYEYFLREFQASKGN